MKRWLRYAKPYWVYFILGPLCMIVEVIGEILMPRFYSHIVDIGIATGSTGYIVTSCLLMVLTALMMMAGGVGGAIFASRASVNFAADVRRDVYKRIQAFSFENIDRFSTGSLITRLTNDITQVMNMINMLMRMCLRAPGMMIGAIIMAIVVNRSLARILLVTMPLLIVLIGFVIRIGYPRFSKMQTKLDKLNQNIQEDLTNVRVIKSFVREDHEIGRFGEANRDLKDTALSALRLMIFILPAAMLLMNLTVVGVIYFGGRQVITETMKVGDLTSFVNYITQILMSLMMLTMIFLNASRAMASAKRISEVLDEPITLNDESAAHPEARVLRGDIRFEHVSFRYYKTSESMALDDIDLSISAGETVGIIGSTGSGKTTLVSMIPRLYDADEGRVTIDGIDVRDYRLRTLRDGVSMVLQNNLLFSGTIAENLRWGDENASDEELAAAAQAAQADGFITGFREGYESSLDQGGSNVSGGQKQRLCIARALLKKPRILILDDSTSAVDTATEARIRAYMRDHLKDVTKLIIAQRISSVRDADKIVVMDEGHITGVGTHEQLLRDNREYQEIYYSQIDREEVGA